MFSDVVRLLRQTHGLFGMNGLCTIADLRLLSINHGLSTSGPSGELVEWVHTNIIHITKSQSLDFEEAVCLKKMALMMKHMLKMI